MLFGLWLVKSVELSACITLVGEETEMDDEYVLEDLFFVEAEVGGTGVGVGWLFVEGGYGGARRVVVIAVAQGTLEGIAVVDKLDLVGGECNEVGWCCSGAGVLELLGFEVGLVLLEAGRDESLAARSR